MSDIAKIDDGALIGVLKASLYPGAADASVALVLSYCRAADLDPMQKPVHIVPMWDKAAGGMRDVIMPGVGLYRTQAARSGQYAGVSEPEFGPDVTAKLGGVDVTYPAWCRVTVRRMLPSGQICDFTAREMWTENYATVKRDSLAPNAMWSKRPYGQLAKCAEAQALRKAFPEFGAQPTAEEMEGKSVGGDVVAEVKVAPDASPELIASADAAASLGLAAYGAFWGSISGQERKAIGANRHAEYKTAAALADERIAAEAEGVQS